MAVYKESVICIYFYSYLIKIFLNKILKKQGKYVLLEQERNLMGVVKENET